MIPKHAKSVFKGELFELFQWDQEMYDGSTAVFEALRRPDTAEIITVVGDKIVIQRQQQPHKADPFTTVPGGRIELDEDPLEGAKRELLEETGMVSDHWELWGARKGWGKIDWTMYIYVARGCKKVAEQNLDAGERIELREVDFEEFLRLANSGELRNINHELLIELVRAYYDPASREAMRKKIFG